MSCSNWFVGERCQALVSFQIVTKQMNGPNIINTISEGYTGTVRQKMNLYPHEHKLLIFWDQLHKTLTVDEDKFKYLGKTDENSTSNLQSLRS